MNMDMIENFHQYGETSDDSHSCDIKEELVSNQIDSLNFSGEFQEKESMDRLEDINRMILSEYENVIMECELGDIEPVHMEVCVVDFL